ncbi:MAG: DUF1826 domain-containing protein [Sandaracinaceae bacterium]|nr:DUF1826 domain-containing protein [Sandaracinaceae bacterium]
MDAISFSLVPEPLERALAPILEPDRAVLCLPRPLPPGSRRALAQVAARPPFEVRARLDASDADPSPLLVHVAHAAARAYLARDIAALAAAFGALLDRRHVHAQLAVVTHDACRKLHADFVTLRLLRTYAGPGTEWVDAPRREHLARADVDVETANRLVLGDAPLQRAAAGDVVLLKGEGWPGQRGAGAVHRSPPIVAAGLRRLVLKLDEHPCGC